MGGKNNARLTEKGVENDYAFRDRVIRNERFKLCIDTKRNAVAFYDLLENPEENVNLIDSWNSEIRKENFNALYNVTRSFPEKDADPKYKDNPAQEWDVEVSAKIPNMEKIVEWAVYNTLGNYVLLGTSFDKQLNVKLLQSHY